MLKSKNRFTSNGVYHALQKTGFVGAGVNGRHRVDLTEFDKRKQKDEKPKGKPIFDDEAEEAEETDPNFDPTHEEGDCEDPKEHLKQIAKHAKKLKKVAVDIGGRIDEMRRMGLE